VHQWALVSNGKTLRLLRDAATLTRPSYLEFDLQDLLAGQRLAEFAFAWRLLHASRAGLLAAAQGRAPTPMQRHPPSPGKPGAKPAKKKAPACATACARASRKPCSPWARALCNTPPTTPCAKPCKTAA
jgi:hypothetical protein